MSIIFWFQSRYNNTNTRAMYVFFVVSPNIMWRVISSSNDLCILFAFVLQSYLFIMYNIICIYHRRKLIVSLYRRPSSYPLSFKNNHFFYFIFFFQYTPSHEYFKFKRAYFKCTYNNDVSHVNAYFIVHISGFFPFF